MLFCIKLKFLTNESKTHKDRNTLKQFLFSPASLVKSSIPCGPMKSNHWVVVWPNAVPSQMKPI